jgi:Flp pilus assembly protein TadG
MNVTPTSSLKTRLPSFCGKRSPRLARFQHDQSGAAAIEFAVVAPLFFFLMFVIAETALIFIAEQVMDNAVFESARLVRTGQVQKASMSEADFKADVCGRMAVFVNCNSSDFFLEVKSYAKFSDMPGKDNKPINADGSFQNASAYQFGGEGAIVVLRAYYQWPTSKISGGLSLASPGLNGKRLIGSFAAFRNEPFGPTP